MLKNHLSDWIINYNYITKTWRAVKRDDYRELFNGGNNIIKSNKLDTLVEILNRTNGDKIKLNSLIK